MTESTTIASPTAPSQFREPDRKGVISSLSRRGFHHIAYVEWGDPAAERVAICVHGLSRQGRDFDVLAATMADQGWRVICPDLVGRGRSDWLKDAEEYNLPQYATDMAAIIARSGAATVDWIGTSLGGLVGMVLAGQARSPIGRLVINDVGPFLPWQALNRLATSVRSAPRTFPTMAAVEQHLRTSLAPFGDLTDAQWQHLAEHGVRQDPDGLWRKRADPDITAAFRPGLFFNLSLWNYWDAITCPVLVLRGATSDLLLPATAAEMMRRGPGADIREIPGCGHAPALMDPAQNSIITEWLDSVPSDHH